MNLNHFIGKDQLSVMRSNCKGEEGEYFKTMIEDLEKTIANMPKTYETDGQGDAAPVTLHYFKGGSDWYIIERDLGGEQLQAFGFASLNGDKQNAEFGYVCIEELIKLNVEIDLYYKPETVRDIKIKYSKPLEEHSDEIWAPEISDMITDLRAIGLRVVEFR